MSSQHGQINRIIDRLTPYFHESESRCPYGLPHQAVYRVARFHKIPEEIMGALLAGGYRRNGSSIYTMCCPNCQACRPIRLVPADFTSNRNQRRALDRNRDIRIVVTPPAPDPEKFALLQKFFDQRFPGRQNSAKDYYAGFFLNSSGFTLEIQYLLDQRLLGVSIVDVGISWLNAVYFFFDPEQSKRSLGTFNIVQLVQTCLEHDFQYLYLGYAIAGVQAMNYKSSFRPHQILENGNWQTCNHPHREQTPNRL